MIKQTIVAVYFIASCLTLKAQTYLSSDELFKSARDAAFNDKDRGKARQLAQQALDKSPTYTDIEIFLGRLDTWDDNYDSARYHFDKALAVSPENEDASNAYADLEYWNDHYKESLAICEKALITYPNSEDLLLRKAKNLNALKRYTDAGAITNQLLKNNKKNAAALALALRLKDAISVNKISLSYDYSHFDKQYDQSWHLGSIAYSRSTKPGTVTAKINYGNRFGTGGVQGELDAYPRISKTFYSYVNVGYSDKVGVFPKFRAGFSLYANLPSSFEAEAGIRYLYFTSATNVYTFYVGKYYKSFLFSARTYITPAQSSASKSLTLAARYYMGGTDDYVGINIGTGVSPDEVTQNIQFNTKNKFSTRQAAINFSHTLLKWNIISLGARIINQEYKPSVKGNQLDLSIGLAHRF